MNPADEFRGHLGIFGGSRTADRDLADQGFVVQTCVGFLREKTAWEQQPAWGLDHEAPVQDFFYRIYIVKVFCEQD